MSDSALSIAFNPAGIELDPKKGLSRQLYQALRQRVLDGRLGSGSRLPASRDLAAALGISRNSVVRAYDQLYAEGFIEGRIGDGTYVAQLPEKALPRIKLSTNLSTGFSTGLSPGLSTKQGDLPVVTSSKVIHSTALERVGQHSLDLPPGAFHGHFGWGCQLLTYSLSRSGASYRRLFGVSRTCSNCVMAIRQGMSACAG